MEREVGTERHVTNQHNHIWWHRPSFRPSLPPNIRAKLPPIVLGLVGPIGMDLSHILLNHNVVILLAYVLALVVMVHSLFPVAFNDVLPEDSYRLICHLPFPRALLRRLKELYRVVCPSILRKYRSSSIHRSIESKRIGMRKRPEDDNA